MTNQNAAWQLDKKFSLAFACVANNGEALFWAVIVFRSHRWCGRHSETVADPEIYKEGFFNYRPFHTTL